MSLGVHGLTRPGSGGRVSPSGWAGHCASESLPSKTKVRREVGLAAQDLDASAHFGAQASWRIAKTVAISGGRSPGPRRSPPRRLWAGRTHWTGCHLARSVSRLTSAGGSVDPRQGLGSPAQGWRGFGTDGEWGCPKLSVAGLRRASFFLRLGRPLLKWVFAEQNEGMEGNRTRCLRPQVSWRIAKTVAVSGGRTTGPPRSPPPRLWTDGIRRTGCHRARFISRLTSTGGSVDARQVLGAPAQWRRGFEARDEPR